MSKEGVKALMDSLTEREIRQIESSLIYFTASAPLEATGHVNVSPKGMKDTFVIIDSKTVAYLDLTGSGAETAAHVTQNGRITLMWCSFDEKPNILRLFGTAQLHREGSEEFVRLLPLFGKHLGCRGIFEVKIERVSNTCGFGVPVAPQMIEREDLDEWLVKKGETGLAEYQARKNAYSIDGLRAYAVQQ